MKATPGENRAEPGKGEENLSILRGPGRVCGLPPPWTTLPRVSDSQGEAWKGRGLGYRGWKARASFLSHRLFRIPPLALTGVLTASDHLPHHTGISISAHQTAYTHARQNVVSTCKVRAMKGKEKTLKSRQGMGCWGPGGTWDEIYSLLLGFLLLGIPKAKVGPECMEPPSSAHPQALDAMPQCPRSGTGGHLGLPQAKVSMSTSSRLAPTPGLQTQQL